MLIYVNITDRRIDRQTHQKYSSEPHKRKGVFDWTINLTYYTIASIL
jgi:hypothetical protein